MEGSSQDYVLEHENAANAQVENVKKEKEFIVRKAQEAARKELDEYKQIKEKECNDAITVLTSNTNQMADIKKKSDIEVEQINKSYENNKEKVITALFEHVITVKYEVPDVVKGKFAEKYGIKEDSD